MKDKRRVMAGGVALAAAMLVAGAAVLAADKYTLEVPGGLAFADFKGYEGWQVISVSNSGKLAKIGRAHV